MADIKTIVARLKEAYPDAECSLGYEGDPFRLLVMARLAAQCTDARVNAVSGALFGRYPDAAAFAVADQAELEQYIFSCGLYRSKAHDIIAAAKRVCEVYGGKVPGTLEELLTLPGVGRKIANLMLGDVFGVDAVVTDTHCIRIANRLALADSSVPVKVERALAAILLPGEAAAFCHRLVLFGREWCRARNPGCGECFLGDLCEWEGKE